MDAQLCALYISCLFLLVLLRVNSSGVTNDYVSHGTKHKFVLNDIVYRPLVETNATQHGVSLALTHVDSPHSPLRPTHCGKDDEACVRAARRARHNAATLGPSMRNKAPSRNLKETVLVFATQAQIVYGTQLDYFTTIKVGTAPGIVSQYVFLDTGSDLTWIQAYPCDFCQPQESTHYLSLASPTSKDISCCDIECLKLFANGNFHGCDLENNCNCLYKYGYGQNDREEYNEYIQEANDEYSLGRLATEVIQLTNQYGVQTTIPNIMIGLGHEQTLTMNALAAGILGLGGGGRSEFSMPDQIALNGPQISKQFSYCLPKAQGQEDGLLLFGASSIDLFQDAIFVQMPQQGADVTSTYYIPLTKILVNEEEVPNMPLGIFDIDEEGEGGVIIDSGTSYTTLTTEAYLPFKAAFIDKASRLSNGPQGPPHSAQLTYIYFDTCWNVEPNMPLPDVPTVTFVFDDGKKELVWRLSKEKTVFFEGDDQFGEICLAFSFLSKAKVSVLGAWQQQRMQVLFDLPQNKIGFSSNHC